MNNKLVYKMFPPYIVYITSPITLTDYWFSFQDEDTMYHVSFIEV